MSSVWKNSMISFASGAPPETPMRNAAAEPILDLRVDEAVGEAMPHREQGAERRGRPGAAR